ncbi:hypothetical protein EMIHUDRAFT_256723 [Emiliania huxleyi CCMP1516]|uniref:Uncharacterized protein n=2 Tax=Emiliania huxleyi TaxID=2903 RepID=A0A0D3IRP8_EMIH1|nr:hypothetical protein EMIHUDRAFT_256723 [Emiliania huxleyi CCMP1516]EOD13933.1 hypothetical protein EMIHUDRAFT_256723 [Emiliania huxleyi CCMP1516]|eukprot:XP_005766362.1 hypothetical protein EMIHUDRAFT_256723 [Emiliania huxleyi CCMP1516]
MCQLARRSRRAGWLIERALRLRPGHARRRACLAPLASAGSSRVLHRRAADAAALRRRLPALSTEQASGGTAFHQLQEAVCRCATQFAPSSCQCAVTKRRALAPMADNASLADLARERLARRGPPPPPAARSVALPAVPGWKLLAAVLAGWAALAWTQRSACGCGAEHSPEQALADALSGLGQLLSGAKSARSVQQSFGQSMERLQQSCDSRLSSAARRPPPA